MRGALSSLLLVSMLTAFLVPLTDSTAEGDALYTMMQKWSVVFPGWVSGGDPCSPSAPPWPYVQCRSGSVVGLNVTNTGITGSIPSEVGNLQYLEVLDVSNVGGIVSATNNSLKGPLHDTLAQCTRLRSFNASNIFWNMEFPMVLTKVTSLEELYFSTSALSGTIPDDFYSNLQNLRSLFIGDNDLKGSLPKMVNLQKLILLTAFQNDFTGMIPPELSTLTDLQYFNCHTCNLYGALPDSFAQLRNLQNLTLHRNNITGPVPDAWRNMTNMKTIRIDQNYLSGNFPTWMITDWPSLNFLQLTKNRFSGQVPDIAGLDLKYNISYNVKTLKFDCNYLEGPKPCLETNCSAVLEAELNSGNYDFDKNCYSDSNQDVKNAVTDCLPYHPADVDCNQFYLLSSTGKCLPCPASQVLVEASQCICTLASGNSGGNGVPVGGVVGGAIGLLLVSLIIIAAVLYKRRKHFAIFDMFTVKGRKGCDFWEAPPGVERFSLPDLARITQDFSDANVIGKGGFGKVYVGTLPDGKMVAIKRASTENQHEDEQFHNEVSLLSRLHHRNLVKLEGFCDDDGLQILVYEFMRNGNLHAHLLGKRTTTPLHWYRRLEIAYGVAQGLEYLHSFADPPVIHRDVKPSNILLDNHMVAKVADFGISKVNPEDDTHVSTRPAGTAGYLDPDYFMRRQLTTASDVYAYGVVLLELVTGQEAIDHMRHEEFNLIEWVKKRFKTAGIVSIIDPLIEDDYNIKAYTKMAELGLQCASFDRSQRPTMKMALSVLEPLMVMENLYPEANVQVKKGEKPHKPIRTAFDTECLLGEQPVTTDNTGRSTESNPYEIGREIGSLSVPLGPR
ncbi:unnamed protein product [Calypogeia fissa]